MTEDYDRERLQGLLIAGAQLADLLPQKAAVHLLNWTELPGRADFAAHVEVADVPDLHGREVRAAFVTDWSALARHEGLLGLTGSDERLIALAASLAAGVPVDLRAAACGFGHASAKRVLEAIAIASGADQFYSITDNQIGETV